MLNYLKARLVDLNRGTTSGEVIVIKSFEADGNRASAAFYVMSTVAAGNRTSWTEYRDRLDASDVYVTPEDAVRGEGAIAFSVTGPLFYKKVSNWPDAEHVSLTTFAVGLDTLTVLRTQIFGENSLDPVGIFALNAGATVSISAAARQNASPEVNRPAAGSVAIIDGYTRSDIYTGFSGYHHNQRNHRFNTPLVQDKPWRIGIELEVYAKNQEAYNTITGARSNWFQCESDSSLSQASFPIELKTIPLRACDAKSTEFWAEPMRRLSQLAKSKGYSSTGLHVHIGKEILGETESERQETLRKLCWFYVYRVESVSDAHQKNVTICGREQGYHCSLSAEKSELADFAEEIGYKVVVANKRAFDRMANDVKSKVESNRWDINLNNYDTYGTVEFRKGDGRISKTRLAGLVTWWEQMTLYCRNHRQDELDFDEFFQNVCADYPAVNYFFNQDEEA